MRSASISVFIRVHPWLTSSPCCHTNKLKPRLQAGRPRRSAGRRRLRRARAPVPDPKFGDYQSNALMSLAKARKMNPRQLATDVLAKLDVSRRVREGGNRRRGLPEFPARSLPRSAQTLRAAARGEHLFFDKAAAAAHRRHRFQFAQRRQADARRPHPLDRSSATRSQRIAAAARPPRHHATTTSATGARSSACCCVGWKQILDRAALERDAIAELERLYKIINAECDAESRARSKRPSRNWSSSRPATRKTSPSGTR